MSRNSAAPVESPIRPVTAEGTGGGLSVPLEPYRSPEFFAAERERLFGRAWLLMGRIEELPTPRSHVVRRVDICNASILITRDGGDIVRAFHNICPHRANLLVRTESGRSEEHTSELQSLLRISYAVVCLQKKIQ